MAQLVDNNGAFYPTNQGVVGSSPAGRANFHGTWQRKPSPPSCCGTVVGPLIHRSAETQQNSRTCAKPGPPFLLWDPVGTPVHTSALAVGYAQHRPCTARSTSRFACLVGDPHRHSHNDRPSNDWHGQGVLRDLRRKRPPLAIDTRTSGEGHGCELTALSLRVGRTGNRCCSWC
jgi:hypothetical protein